MSLIEILLQETISSDVYSKIIHQQNAWFQFSQFLQKSFEQQVSEQGFEKLFISLDSTKVWTSVIQGGITKICYQAYKEKFTETFLQNKVDLIKISTQILKHVQIIEILSRQFIKPEDDQNYRLQKDYLKDFQNLITTQLSTQLLPLTSKIFNIFLRESYFSLSPEIREEIELEFVEEEAVQKERVILMIQTFSSQRMNQEIECMLMNDCYLCLQKTCNSLNQKKDSTSPILNHLQLVLDNVIIKGVEQVQPHQINMKQIASFIQIRSDFAQMLRKALFEIHSQRCIENIVDCILYYPDTVDTVREFKKSLDETQFVIFYENHFEVQRVSQRVMQINVQETFDYQCFNPDNLELLYKFAKGASADRQLRNNLWYKLLFSKNRQGNSPFEGLPIKKTGFTALHYLVAHWRCVKQYVFISQGKTIIKWLMRRWLFHIKSTTIIQVMKKQDTSLNRQSNYNVLIII